MAPGHRPPALPTVLVDDDFADGRELLVEYLTYRGFAVHSAENAEQAIEITRTVRPDIVLLDLSMPGPVNGWEAARILTTDPQTRGIVLLAVTACTSRREIDAAIASGCAAVICKPFDINALGDALPRLLTAGVAALDVPGLTLTELPPPIQGWARWKS